jgi:hypothetical protein
MKILNALLNRLFDILLGPFRAENPWPAMVVVCLLTTVSILLIFKWTSNPKALQKQKNRAIARLLEFVLFKDDIVVNLGAFGRVMIANLAYLGTLIIPLLISLIPVALILIQLSCWFSMRPLRPGETAVLTARLPDRLPVMKQTISLEASAGLDVEAGPVRAPSQNEISWRLRIRSDGDAWADVNVNGTKIRKSIATGNRLSRLAPLRPQAGGWTELTHPAEAPLPAEGPLTAIRIQYPSSGLDLGGHSHNWLLVFCILALVFGVLLLKPMRVVI